MHVTSALCIFAEPLSRPSFLFLFSNLRILWKLMLGTYACLRLLNPVMPKCTCTSRKIRTTCSPSLLAMESIFVEKYWNGTAVKCCRICFCQAHCFFYELLSFAGLTRGRLMTTYGIPRTALTLLCKQMQLVVAGYEHVYSCQQVFRTRASAIL